ncbi:cytokine-like protein 1 isoform X2 [Chiloscyllium plagiosum]|uniref:cytokine-like protein 1 isoform X2 n=1 Tax=Chiloscyllium plagiosum TaxID=36176 RepID=UPI001CB7DA4D|nr:cytokine-like protein 1 isoform X2 [Chiloscyllium plagiosum]
MYSRVYLRWNLGQLVGYKCWKGKSPWYLVSYLPEDDSHGEDKRCLANLPKLYINVHNSCVMTKLRDHLYSLDNLLTPQCRELKRIALLKLRIKRFYNLISRFCYRDLVFFTDDCADLERPPPPDPQEDLSQ